jgi:nucleoside-diphosphate-sugar epimerase
MSHPGGPSGLPGMTTQTVLLAGASGVFGRHVTRVLGDAGYRVLGLGRGSANDIRADINDRDALLRALDGQHADIVVHAATALAKPPMRHRDMHATDVLRTVGMRNLVEGYHAVGASKFIAESMVFGYGYGEHGSALLTEDAPFAPVQPDPRVEEHVAAMRTKEELTAGLGGVNLRYGLFYGPDATEPMVAMMRKRMMPAPPAAGRALPWVHLADAAEAMLAAIRHGEPGAAYNIVDDVPMAFGDHLRLTAEAFGAPKPLAVPPWLLRPAGALLAAMLRTNLRLSNAKARDELGWVPEFPGAAQGLAAMVAP